MQKSPVGGLTHCRLANTVPRNQATMQLPYCHALKFWPSPCTSPRREVGLMQTLITFTTAVAGLTFSLAIAVLAEELFFGQVFRLLVARQTVRAGNRQGR
jgi:hypothetical protein